MSFLPWLTRNWADTDEAGDPLLAPLDLPLPPPEAEQRVAAAVRSLPRWRVEGVDSAAGTIRATRSTRLFRFIDDITVRLEPVPSGTRVHARSRSRVGVGDLGQNRRNLLELLDRLQRE
jgi:uncharacterized protein (DUF1499 family)